MPPEYDRPRRRADDPVDPARLPAPARPEGVASSGPANPAFGHSLSRLGPDPDDQEGLPGAVIGEAGAMGRNTFVKRQEGRAFDAGLNAPQIDFDGTLHRTVNTQRKGVPTWEGYVDHLGSDVSGGRYNDVGERLIYASPSAAESLGEMGAYGSMAGRTAVDLHYQAGVDPATGTGGVADVSGHLPELGLTRDALTGRKGGEGPDLFHRLMGEDPYLYPRALGRGAQEGGASGMLVPSATGGNQLDIIPRNTDPAQIQYESHTHYDANGAGPLTVDPAHLNQHAAPGGPGVMPPGDAPVPTDAYHIDNPFETSTGATSRAGSLRYGLAGGLAGALVNDALQGRAPDAADLALQGGAGMGGGVAQDLLHARMGGGVGAGIGAGGAIGALTSGAFSAYDNGEAYRQGRETAGQATANTLVDTGVGLGAGLTGAAAGAAIGSIIPVAGTAVGAGVGFLAGMAGSYGASWLAEHSGLADRAKHGLGGALNHYNKELSGVWDGVGHVTEGIHNGWQAAGSGLHHAGHAVADGAAHAWHGAEHLAAQGVHGAEDLATRGFHGAQRLGGDIAQGAAGALSGAEHMASSAVHGVEDAASAGWHTLSGWF